MSKQELTAFQKKMKRLDAWQKVKVLGIEIVGFIFGISYVVVAIGLLIVEPVAGDWLSIPIVVTLVGLGFWVNSRYIGSTETTGTFFDEEDKTVSAFRFYENGWKWLARIGLHTVVLVLSWLAIFNVQYNFSGKYRVYNVEVEHDSTLPEVSYLHLKRNEVVKYSTDLDMPRIKLKTFIDINNDQITDYVLDAFYTLKFSDSKSWSDLVHAKAKDQENSTRFFQFSESARFLIMEGLGKKLELLKETDFREEDFTPLVEKAVRALFLEKGLKLEVVKVELETLNRIYPVQNNSRY